MSKTSSTRPEKLPAYRKHKRSGLALVTLPNGPNKRRDVYLGKHGTKESRAAYDRTIAEWIAAGRRVPAPSTSGTALTINEMNAAILPVIERHYRRPDGTTTRELDDFKANLKRLRELYGDTAAQDFDPLKLKALRESLIADDLSLGVINQRIGRIRRAFRWAVEQNQIPPTVYAALALVADLPKGRGFARETKRVKAVNPVHVEAIRNHVLPEVWAMIETQRACACRPGEVCQMRPCDIDTSGEIWDYRPQSHKTAWRGHDREIPLGATAQAAIKPFLPTCPTDYIFSPRRAIEAKRERLRASRKTKVQPSQITRAKRKPKRTPGECYNSRSYAQAIAKGVEKADAKLRAAAIKRAMKLGQKPPGDKTIFVEHWHPHQLRHLAANEARKKYGYESAAALLGDKVNMVEVYTERDRERAHRIAAEAG